LKAVGVGAAAVEMSNPFWKISKEN